MGDYLSVSQLAREARISRAAAYSMLEQERYKEYLVTDGGVKRVKSSILDILKEGIQAQEESAGNDKPPAQTDSTEDHETEIDRLREEVNYLKRTIEEKDKQIVDFAVRFADLAQQAQQIAGQAQVLQLNEASKEVPKIDQETTEEPTRRGFWNKLFGR